MAFISKKSLAAATALTGVVVGLGMGGMNALAADLPSRKAPVVAPVVAPLWTGFYVGIEGGGVWDNDRWRTTALLLPATPDNGSRVNMNPTGGRIGVLAGYNWQLSDQIVAGVEADIAGDFFGKKTVHYIPGTLTSFGPPTPASTLDSVTDNGSTFDGSLRARLGYLVTPSVLLYSTGGLAFSNPKFSVNCPGTGVNGNLISWCGLPESGSSNSTRLGWTLGAGVEAIVAKNWTARLEYRYNDYGSKTTTFFPTNNFGADGIVARTSVHTSMITVAIAYKW